MKSTLEKGTTTDFNGNFSLTVGSIKDTLVVFFISYKNQEIALKTLKFKENLTIILEEKAHSLEEVVIEAKDPISEQFAVTKMNIVEDVYLNPSAQTDPLKAIANLPVSTTTDENGQSVFKG